MRQKRERKKTQEGRRERGDDEQDKTKSPLQEAKF